MWQYTNTDELYHFGIKGMKWGIRRYQNKDGTLTAIGRKRNRRMSQDAREANRIKKKKVSEMSNDELRKINTRSELESKYYKANPNAIKIGKALIDAYTAGATTYLAIKGATTTYKGIAKFIAKKAAKSAINK